MKRRKVIGYLRVSTYEQDTEKNEAAVLKFANNNDFGRVNFVSEKVSGAKSWKKRKLYDVVQELDTGDILIVPELSRLGRSIVEILEVLAILKDKEVRVYSVKENFQMNGDDIQSKIMRTLLALFAEVERDIISARTKEGLAAARAKGKILGRPKGTHYSKLDKDKAEIVQMLKNGVKKVYICEQFNCTTATLWSWLKKHKLQGTKPEFKKPKN